VYAFPSPTTTGNIVLVLTTASPIAAGVADSFDPNKLYQIKIDNNVSGANARDGVENLVLQFTFKGTGAGQTVSMRGPVAPVSTGQRNKIVNVEPSWRTINRRSRQATSSSTPAQGDPSLDLAQFFARAGSPAGDRTVVDGAADTIRSAPRPANAVDYLRATTAGDRRELPASMLTGTGNGKIGIWATTSR
jgi:hypothetical protein